MIRLDYGTGLSGPIEDGMLEKIAIRYRVWDLDKKRFADPADVENGVLQPCTGFQDRDGQDIYVGHILNMGDFGSGIAMIDIWRKEPSLESARFGVDVFDDNVHLDEYLWGTYKIVGHAVEYHSFLYKDYYRMAGNPA